MYDLAFYEIRFFSKEVNILKYSYPLDDSKFLITNLVIYQYQLT